MLIVWLTVCLFIIQPNVGHIDIYIPFTYEVINLLALVLLFINWVRSETGYMDMWKKKISKQRSRLESKRNEPNQSNLIVQVTHIECVIV